MARPKKKLSESLLSENLEEISKAEKELSISPKEVDILAPINKFEPDEIKKKLEIKRKFVTNSLSGKKLNQALNLFNVIEGYSDILLDPEIFEKVRGSIETTKDLRFLVDAIVELNGMVNNLMRPDTIDETGATRRINISIGYQDGTVKID